jgi:hypothetical protein
VGRLLRVGAAWGGGSAWRGAAGARRGRARAAVLARLDEREREGAVRQGWMINGLYFHRPH